MYYSLDELDFFDFLELELLLFLESELLELSDEDEFEEESCFFLH